MALHILTTRMGPAAETTVASGTASLAATEALAFADAAFFQERSEMLGRIVSGSSSVDDDHPNLYDRLMGVQLLQPAGPPTMPPPDMFKVRFKNGVEFPLFLTQMKATIGSGSRNSLIFPDANLSTQHAEVTYQGGFFWIRDLKSDQGTRLNGTLLDPEHWYRFQSTDEIQLADRTFKILLPNGWETERQLFQRYEELRGHFSAFEAASAASLLEGFTDRVLSSRTPEEFVQVVMTLPLPGAAAIARELRQIFSGRHKSLNKLPDYCGIREKARELQGLQALANHYLPGMDFSLAVDLMEIFADQVSQSENKEGLVATLRTSPLQGMLDVGDRLERYFAGEWMPLEDTPVEFGIRDRLVFFMVMVKQVDATFPNVFQELDLTPFDIVDRPWMKATVPAGLRAILNRYLSRSFMEAPNPIAMLDYQLSRLRETLLYDQRFRQDDDAEVLGTMQSVTRDSTYCYHLSYQGGGWLFGRDEGWVTAEFQGRFRFSMDAEYAAFNWVLLNEVADVLLFDGVRICIRMSSKARAGYRDGFIYFRPEDQEKVLEVVHTTHQGHLESFRSRAAGLEIPVLDAEGMPLKGVSWVTTREFFPDDRDFPRDSTFAEKRLQAIQKTHRLVRVLFRLGEKVTPNLMDQVEHMIAFFFQRERIDLENPALDQGASSVYAWLLQHSQRPAVK